MPFRKLRNLSHREAAQYVENTDRERIRFIQDHFGKDPTDSRHYDLVLNASRFALSLPSAEGFSANVTEPLDRAMLEVLQAG